jgi:HD superfamily phosphohydrolase
MIAMAMEEAKDELGLVDFQSPEEYLALNDYTAWTMLKACERSKRIMENLERRKLLKRVYERTFYMREKTMTDIFGVGDIRDQMRNKIASEAGVEPQSVIIDVPTVPSVPYRHSVLLEPMEIPVFQKTKEGKKIAGRLSDVSGVFDVLKGFMNILRVYAEEEYREKVGSAAAKVFGEEPFSAKISF